MSSPTRSSPLRHSEVAGARPLLFTQKRVGLFMNFSTQSFDSKANANRSDETARRRRCVTVFSLQFASARSLRSYGDK